MFSPFWDFTVPSNIVIHERSPSLLPPPHPEVEALRGQFVAKLRQSYQELCQNREGVLSLQSLSFFCRNFIQSIQKAWCRWIFKIYFNWASRSVTEIFYNLWVISENFWIIVIQAFCEADSHKLFWWFKTGNKSVSYWRTISQRIHVLILYDHDNIASIRLQVGQVLVVDLYGLCLTRFLCQYYVECYWC